MKKNIFTLAALLIASAAFVACSSSNDEITEQQPVNPTGEYIMTVKACKGSDAATRALSLDGSTLNATWAENEKVNVFEGSTPLGTLTPVLSTIHSGEGENNTDSYCTLTGKITAPSGNSLTLKYKSADYDGQNGTLSYISEHCDYAKAENVTISVSGNTITTENTVNFVNQNAIARFQLKDGNTILKPTKVTITPTSSNEIYQSLLGQFHLGHFEYTIPATTYGGNDDGYLYFAMPGLPDDNQIAELIKTTMTLTITATVPSTIADDYGSEYVYTYTKSSYPFTNSKYYVITVNMTDKKHDLTKLTDDYTAKDGEVLTGTTTKGVQTPSNQEITVTLSDLTINSSNSYGFECQNSATIILADGTTNTLTSGGANHPGLGAYNGVQNYSNINITIKGSTGKLIATGANGGNGGAGIGGFCGDIVIEGGDITANGGTGAPGIGGKCGDIEISGGTIEATGGSNGAGIGSGAGATCGNITITNGVTSVTATKGTSAVDCIGRGYYGNCSKVTVGGTVYWNGSYYNNEGETEDNNNYKAYLQATSQTYTPTN